MSARLGDEYWAQFASVFVDVERTMSIGRTAEVEHAVEFGASGLAVMVVAACCAAVRAAFVVGFVMMALVGLARWRFMDAVAQRASEDELPMVLTVDLCVVCCAGMMSPARGRSFCPCSRLRVTSR